MCQMNAHAELTIYLGLISSTPIQSVLYLLGLCSSDIIVHLNHQ